MPENHKDFKANFKANGPAKPIDAVRALLIYATCPTAAEAERIGGALLDQGLAACINILPGMTSLYVWQGQRHRDSEAVMLVKTVPALGPRVVAAIRALHPYDTPAIPELQVAGGNDDFLAWIEAQTTRAAAPR